MVMNYKRHPNYPTYKIFPDGSIISDARVIVRSYQDGSYRNISRPEVKIKGWVKYQNDKAVSVIVGLINQKGEKEENKLHRIVLETFIGNAPEGMEGCHNDGNPLNNNISNLRWDTHANNIRDCMMHGTKTNPPTFYGEKHHNTSLKECDIMHIRAHKITRGIYSKLAKDYNVSSKTISRIMNYKTWNHKESFNNVQVQSALS